MTTATCCCCFDAYFVHFAAVPLPSQETDRLLRQEQDSEYERSLAADQQREAARAAAQAEAEAAAQAAEEAAERAR